MRNVESVWMDENGKIEPDSFFRTFDEIKAKSRFRIETDRFHCSLYYDRAYQGFTDGRSLDALFDPDSFFEGRLNENVILRILSMASAKFARQKTAPGVLTDLGDWGLQQRADLYKRLLQGAFHECRVYDEQRRSDLHMEITGTGGLYGYSSNGKLKVCAIPPWQLFVETADGRDGKPQVLYWRRAIPRRNLLRTYPKLERKIEELPGLDASEAFDLTGSRDADLVEVVTAWSLPSDPDADSEDTDGRVVVMARGQALAQGPWARPRFPIAFSRYMLAPDGFFGIGLIAQLVGMQAEYNRTLATRQVALQNCSASFWAIEKGSEIVESHITDGIGHLVYYRGTKPSLETPTTINPEQFNHGDRVKSAMFQNAGMSELAASSMKPAGINSGVALRTYADMMDDAFHDAMLRRDDQILQLSEILLDEIEAIAEERGDYKTRYHGPFGFERVKYSEVKMDRDDVVLQVVSSSSLATTLSGRIEDVAGMQDLGIALTPDEKETLINIPDLSTSRARRNSMSNLLRELCEVRMLGKGKYIPPEPRWDLELALTIVSETILQAQIRNAPTNRIEILRKFELECMALDAANKAAQLTPAEAPLPMPAGSPAIDPTVIDPNLQPVPGEIPSPIAGGEMPAGGIPQ